MATTVLRTVYPTNSYDPEIAGVPLITLAGVDVDNTKLTAVQARAVIDGVTLVSGGVAGSPSTASPVSQPNVTTSTPGAPVSGSYAVGQLSVDSTGALWVCTVAGSPGTWQAAQTGTFAPLTGQPVSQQLVHRKAVNTHLRGGDRPLMVSPPTPAVSGTNPGSSRITSAVSIANNDFSLINVQGGTPNYYGGSSQYTYFKTDLSTLDPFPYALSFMFDGQQFEMQFRCDSAVGGFRVKVDGYYLSAITTATPTDGNTYAYLVDFGSRAVRHITIESSTTWAGLWIGPNDTVWPETRRRVVRPAFLGDSWVAASNATLAVDSFQAATSRALGWDFPLYFGEAGTGYLAPGSGGGRTKYRDRVTNLATFTPDAVVILGSINDPGTYTANQIQTEAGLLYAAIATALPGVPVYVFGVQWFGSEVNATKDAVDAALTTACAAASNVKAFVSQKGWLTGTGKVGSTTGTGNSDLYVASNGDHLTSAGHAYWGQRVARAIAATY